MDSERRPRSSVGRALYHDCAWAYDLIISDDVDAQVDLVAVTLDEHGLETGSRVLDAGCGTGRYARALAARGFRVVAVDRSPELLEQARRAGGAGVEFVEADLVELSLAPSVDAVLCRGVLNDVLDDDERDRVLGALGRALRRGGVLVADVRDWEASVRRYRAQPLFERRVARDGEVVRFCSRTELDSARQRLRVAEVLEVERGDECRRYKDDFVMRCWSEAELHERLRRAGFTIVELSRAPARADRITFVAMRWVMASAPWSRRAC